MKTTTANLPASILTSRQTKTYGPRFIAGYGKNAMITATVRYDDSCHNGHNSFAITADIKERGVDVAGGCLHEEIARVFPELAPLLKWHLVSSDGPMHYVANTVYHAKEHGPKMAWVYFNEDTEKGISRHCVKYCEIEKAKIICESSEYSMAVDEKTDKKRNLDHARSSAVWSEATDEDLTSPGLEDRLLERLPALMVEFKAAVESLGFTY